MPYGPTKFSRGYEGMQPEIPLSSKMPRRPRTADGMTQVRKGKRQPKMTEPATGQRIAHGMALRKAIMGVANRRHPHDGSK